MKVFSLIALLMGLMSFAPIEEAKAQRTCRNRGDCGGNRGGGRVNPRPNRPTPPRVNPRPNRPRPPRVNPRPNRPNRPNPPRVNPRPNRPNPPRVNPRPNRPNRPNPPRVNPRPNRPNPPRVNPRPNRPHRPRVVRPVPTHRRGTRVRRQHRSWNHNRAQRRHRVYGHRPLWNMTNYSYTRNYHSPWRNHQTHSRRYRSSRDYHYTVPYRFIYWNSWLRWRVSRANGYFYGEGYPYYVYNGYRHRYSNYDTCNYELVDGRTNSTYRSYAGYSCSTGYDMCAQLRDDLNYNTSGYRYFCSEKFDRDYSYNYNHDFNNGFYSDINRDWDDNYYYEDNNGDIYDDYNNDYQGGYDYDYGRNDPYNNDYDDNYGW